MHRSVGPEPAATTRAAVVAVTVAEAEVLAESVGDGVTGTEGVGEVGLSEGLGEGLGAGTDWHCEETELAGANAAA